MLDALGSNLLSPPVLFFLLGVIAALLKSDLRVPEPIYLALTLYLLAAIGFKGGVALADAGLARAGTAILAAVALSALTPLWMFPALRKFAGFNTPDAAALAAHYGSVSAVTFTAATEYLRASQIAFEGFAPVLLAVMEAPAILVAVVLGRMAQAPREGVADPDGLTHIRKAPPRENGGRASSEGLMHAVREALVGRSIFVLLGTLAIGFLCGPQGLTKVEPFLVDPFFGVLTFFLLELGVAAGARLRDLRRSGFRLLGVALALPLINGLLGTGLGHAIGLSAGGAALLGVLAASASYIAAPAAVRLSLPAANPTIYLTAALGITFPFNLVVGIPLWTHVAGMLSG
jgi:hypothetical protein